MDNTMVKEVDSSIAKKNGGEEIFTKTHDILKDEVAKVMFTDKHFFAYAKKLVSLILNIDEEDIGTFELAPEYVSQNQDIKGAISDIMYESDGFFIDFEFNSKKGENYYLKNLKYVFHLVLNQIHKNDLEKVSKIKRVTQINFNAFDRYGLNKLVYSSHIAEDESHIIANDYLQIFDITLEKAKEMWYANSEKESLEYYLFAISSRDYDTKYEMYEGDELMAEVVDKMDELKKKFNEDLFYDNEALLKKANYDDGKAAGLKEKSIEIAKKMIEEGFELAVISKITELSIKEIEKLKN